MNITVQYAECSVQFVLLFLLLVNLAAMVSGFCGLVAKLQDVWLTKGILSTDMINKERPNYYK
jgi:hypothetical protein